MSAQTAIAQNPGVASLYDPVLPHLQALLDSKMMSELLAHLMVVHTGRYRAEDCKIERVKYKPAKNCLVVYQLTLFDRNRHVSTRMRLVCRTFEQGGSRSRYIKALRQLKVTTLPSTPRILHIPELEILAWLFPHERKLHSLPLLSDEKHLVGTLLPDVVRNAMGEQWHIESVNHRIVHYVPEHTCSLRVALTLNDRRSGLTRPWVIFGKTYYNDDGRRTEQVMQQLYLAGQGSGGSVSFPRPLYYHEAERILWQEGLSGETLRGEPPQRLADYIRGLVGHYQAHVPWAVNTTELDWYIAAALINERVSRCITRLKSGRLEIANALIGIADDVHRFGHTRWEACHAVA